MNEKKIIDKEAPLNASGKERNITMTRACFNLAKSAVGIGTLRLAGTFAQVGWVLGTCMLLAFSLLSATTHHLLARLAANTDIGDFYGLGKMAYGSFGEMSAVAFTLMYLYGALIAYCDYAGRYISAALVYFTGCDAKACLWMSPAMVTVIVSALFIFPLSCLRDLSKLGMASIAGMACIAYIAVLTVVDYFLDTSIKTPVTLTAFRVDWNVFACFSRYLFAFANHFTTVALVPVLVRPTPARRHQLITYSQVATTAIYLAVAIFGYLHFGDSVNQMDLLESRSNAAYSLAKLAMGLTTIVSYPLLLDPTRSALEHLVTRGAAKAPSAIRHYAITVSLVASSALIAVLGAEQVGNILDVFSSFAGSFLVFVLPAMYFLRMQYKYPVSSIERIMASFDIGLGLVAAVIGTSVCVYGIVGAPSK